MSELVAAAGRIQGDRGEFVLSRALLVGTPWNVLQEFSALVSAHAAAHPELYVTVEDDPIARGGIIVRWRPRTDDDPEPHERSER